MSIDINCEKRDNLFVTVSRCRCHCCDDIILTVLCVDKVVADQVGDRNIFNNMAPEEDMEQRTHCLESLIQETINRVDSIVEKENSFQVRPKKNSYLILSLMFPYKKKTTILVATNTFISLSRHIPFVNRIDLLMVDLIFDLIY